MARGCDRHSNMTSDVTLNDTSNGEKKEIETR